MVKNKKIKLIETMNPKWKDLIDEYNMFDKNIKYELPY